MTGRALRALVLEHWRSNAFVVYGEVLAEREIEVDRILASEVDGLPEWRDYDLILALGGPASVYEEDAHPWLVGEKRLVREAVDSGVPYLESVSARSCLRPRSAPRCTSGRLRSSGSATCS